MAKVRPRKITFSNLPYTLLDKQIKIAIVQAYNRIEEQRLQKEINERQAWRDKIGIVDRITEGSKLKRFWLNLKSDIEFFIKILFIKRQDIREGMATTTIIKMIMYLLFLSLQWLLLICAVFWTGYGVFETIKNGDMAPELITFGIIAFVFSRLFRIATIEVELMDDKYYVVTLFSGIVSFAAMIVAIVALVKR